MACLQPGDLLVVWSLRRLGPSLRHFIGTLLELQKRGIGFMSLMERIDTTRPGCLQMLQFFGEVEERDRTRREAKTSSHSTKRPPPPVIGP